MYKEIISYNLAEDKDEIQLQEIAQKIITQWMKHLPGFISWEINKATIGYSDIVTWESKQHAQQGHVAIKNIDSNLLQEWQSCYGSPTIDMQSLEQIRMM